MLSYFSSTQFKIKVACAIYAIINILGLKQKKIIERNGVKFDIDLSEGIDLSLYLFGNFQKHITRNKLINIPDDSIIFDVGANIGSISIPLAYQYAKGHVYSFEPTHSAFNKLKRNIEINADLIGETITPVQTFVSTSSETSTRLAAYSSWPITNNVNGTQHPVHLGILKDATDRQISLDSFVDENNITRLDLLKIDTDGYELDVFTGAVNCMAALKPIIIFELTTYLLEERKISFSEYEDILLPLGYKLLDAHSGAKINSGNLKDLIPSGGGIDVIALPSKTIYAS